MKNTTSANTNTPKTIGPIADMRIPMIDVSFIYNTVIVKSADIWASFRGNADFKKRLCGNEFSPWICRKSRQANYHYNPDTNDATAKQ
jgi:hypothetical protein